MLIGVTSKNAILVVEFANQAKKEGLSIVKSAIRAAKERLRPILMTAIIQNIILELCRSKLQEQIDFYVCD
jgi:multidrug efflux pump subunit AcrB